MFEYGNQRIDPQFCRLRSVKEMSNIEELQRQIWGYGRDGFDSVYPARALFALSESGGLVSGVSIDGKLVGFSLAWIGREETSGEIYLQSQLLGVLPAYRGMNIGFNLKLKQRDFAVSQQIKLIRWTFDPLQASNARLNLHKLGAVSYQYRSQYYGNLRSHLVHGSSDRLWAEWFVSSQRVCRLLKKPSQTDVQSKIPQAVTCETTYFNDVQLRVPKDLVLENGSAEVTIEIPFSVAEVSTADKSLLESWRSVIRKTMNFYLENGYVIDDFWKHNHQGQNLAFYHLTNTRLEEVVKI